MQTFFKGWRWKVGCCLLAMALALSGAWIRSLVIQDNFHTPLFTLHIHCGAISWFDSTQVGWKWSTQWIDTNTWTGFAGIWQWNQSSITVPYWSLIAPLGVASTCLLFWNVRKREPAKNAVNSTAETN